MPFSVISMLASASLVYIMGRFAVAEILNLKRILEVVFILPIAFNLAFLITTVEVKKFLNPLVLLALVMMLTGLLWGVNFLRLADIFFALLALMLLSVMSYERVLFGIKWIILLATLFAILASIQWVIFLFAPELSRYAEVMYGDDGIVASSFHPIMILGLVTGEEYNFMGLPITRIRSFASEPSLLNIFFIVPAAFAFLMDKARWKVCGIVIMIFCMISFSGSVFLGLGFASLYFLMSFFIKPRILFFFLPLAILTLFLLVLLRQGAEAFLSYNTYLLGMGDFFDKMNSFDTRSQGIMKAFQEMQRSPFGSGLDIDAPVPIFINATLRGGLAAVVLILVFLWKISTRIQQYAQINRLSFLNRAGISVFFGVLCTSITFNDYSMLNYAGLIQLMFMYRLLEEKLAAGKQTQVEG